ncbi:MAG TPA: cysteine dioxygenase family protein [Verrucomicrobiae bacterium]|jgi:predicted metal-dependent enzyme (double-stranded beta helix superfamily)|nr:cysteine dioxygenase family protein [Verrucomicrobiae bacterium]
MSPPYGLEEFVRDMQRVTEAESAPAAIVEACRPLLARLLTNRACIPPEFKRRGAKGQGRYMLHRAPKFNVNVVVWGPGDGLGPHNHGTWGLIGVLENELQEKRYRRLNEGTDPAKARLELTQTLRNRPGDISCLLPADDIHGVLNTTVANTVDIHVYGKDLTGLSRLKFDLENATAVSFSSPKYDNC